MSEVVKTYPCTDLAAMAAKVKAAGGPDLDPSQTSAKDLPGPHGTKISYVVTPSATAPEKVTVTVDDVPAFAGGIVKNHLDSLFGGAA